MKIRRLSLNGMKRMPLPFGLSGTACEKIVRNPVPSSFNTARLTARRSFEPGLL